MPGYGLKSAAEGSGLLPWSWARERLEQSHDYWLATKGPHAPHLMPVWGVWLEEAFWFSSSRASKKARNLAQHAACSISTDNAQEPVIVEGVAERITDHDAMRRFADAVNRKYQTSYPAEFFTTPANACFRVRPRWAFGLMESDFTGSPTRWTFDG